MTPGEKNITTHGGAVDVLLFIAAILGVWAFIYVLPGSHPDSTARYDLDEDEIINRSNIFLATQGYVPDNFTVGAKIQRNTLLLRAMQEDLGRTRTIEVLKSDEGDVLPGYYWSVKYSFEDPAAGIMSILTGATTIFELKMTLDGIIWSFDNNLSENKAALPLVGQGIRSINRDALAAALSGADSTEIAVRNRLRSVSDSSLRANLSFTGVRNGRNRSPFDSVYSAAMLRDLENDRVVELDSQAVYSLARFYAPENMAMALDWRIDSLHVVAGSAARLAALRLISADPVFGQILRVDITVSTLGNLNQLDIVFNPDRESNDITSSVLNAVMVGIYLILSVILLIVFFKRITARLIDVKTAIVDAVMIGIFLGLLAVLSVASIGTSSSPLWVQMGFILLIFSVIAGASSLFVFMISAVSESVTREIWPEKWLSLILIRKGDVRNTDVGWAIVRGISLAGVLLGLGVLALVVSPSLNIDVPQDLFIDSSMRPVLSAIVGKTGFGFLLMMILLVGIGAFAYRVANHWWFAVVLISVFGGILQIAPFGLSVGWVSVGVSVSAAGILGLSMMRFDFFTAFLGYVVAGIFWSLSEGFLIAGSPAWLDGMLATLILSTFFVVGIVGILSRRSGGDIDQFLPEYITELASQERIKRELEIAHQVQSRFLPRRMPSFDGLDIAGMCLPATEVGGDYFDFIKIDRNRLAVVVGDVSGKGIEASFYMTLVKGVIQTLSTSVESPAEVMRRTNDVFRRNAPAGTFITLIYGVVDMESNTFIFSRAGHNPVIFKRHDSQDAEPLQPTGMAIGFTDGNIFDETIEEISIPLSAGDTLVFYTDGFSEAMNSGRELYGDKRLVDKVGRVGARGSGAILRALTEDVHHFIEGAGRSDDMTMVVIKML